MTKDKRPYIKVTLDMPDHPKYAALSRAQKFLIIEGWIHCAKYKTDGVMDMKVWNKFGTKRDRVAFLENDVVEVDAASKTVLFVDFLNHQTSRAEQEAKQNQARSAGQKGGKAKAANMAETSSETLAPATPSASEPLSGSVAEVEVEIEVERKEQKTSSSASPQKAKSATTRGTRLPQDWRPSTALVESMEAECPGLNLRNEHRVFADYWQSAAGARGVKADWDATWRNWMRKAHRENGPRYTNNPGRPAVSRQDEKVQGYLAYANQPESRKELT